MKIGILTFHNPNNYGALLQAYCLQNVIENEGHQVEIIDYRNQAIENRVRPFTFRHFLHNPVKFLIRLINVFYWNRQQEKLFDTFRHKYFHLSKRVVDRHVIETFDYDRIVIGSDQVWNPLLTGGYDPIYFGQFKPKNAKVISYAASSSIKEMQKSDNKNLPKWLESFAAINVREQALYEFIQPFTSKEVKVTIDPTLLAGKDILEKITADRVIKERYIFVYGVEANPNLWSIARKVSREYNARIVTAPMLALSTRIKLRDVKCVNAGILELLSLIKYAECVVALSFHGTALSLLYHKEFYSIKGGNMARVESILKKVGLESRIIDNENQISLNSIDYNSVDRTISSLRLESLNILKTGLN